MPWFYGALLMHIEPFESYNKRPVNVYRPLIHDLKYRQIKLNRLRHCSIHGFHGTQCLANALASDSG